MPSNHSQIKQNEGHCHQVQPTFDGNLLALEVVQVPEQHFLPVASVAYEPKVRQGALWRANFLFHFGK